MSMAAKKSTRVTRRYKRYIVNGSVVLQGTRGESRGTLLNLGQGGILVRTDTAEPQGVDITVLFDVAGYLETFAMKGQVVGINGTLLAIKFLDDLDMAFLLLLDWLDFQHCTWSGVA